MGMSANTTKMASLQFIVSENWTEQGTKDRVQLIKGICSGSSLTTGIF